MDLDARLDKDCRAKDIKTGQASTFGKHSSTTNILYPAVSVKNVHLQGNTLTTILIFQSLSIKT